MKKIISAILLAVAGIQASATIIRVNNTPGTQAAYSTANAAMAAAATGDTLHLEGSSISYGLVTVTKRLVITGTGYFLNDASPNPYTQAGTVNTIIENLIFNPGSKGSIAEGIEVNSYCIISDSLITLQRNYLNGMVYLANSRNVYGDTIRNNYISLGISHNNTNKARDIIIYNNIFAGTAPLSCNSAAANNLNGYCINNSFVASAAISIASANFIYQNNIFPQVSFGTYLSSNSFFNNIAANTGIPAGNSNRQNISMPAVYQGWTSAAGFSTDGRYVLATGSPATGAGVLNGLTVDCGAFGGPAPYVLSGMPPIPSIYSISMPDRINAGTTTMNVTIEAASH